ncbi:A kinase (PRKA) anchor protein 17B [Cricetulus griseus]
MVNTAAPGRRWLQEQWRLRYPSGAKRRGTAAAEAPGDQFDNRWCEDTMTVTVVYDNSEATELCAAQHLYLKPIAKLMINVLLPECIESVRPFSNWEVLDQLKSLICPDQFTTVRLSKSTKDFIRFEGEAETRSLVQILKAKLHGKIIKLNGLKTDLKVVATDAQGEWEHFPKEKEASVTTGAEEQDHEKSPDSIYFEGLPCKWFAPKGSSGEKPCEEILRVVFESFGKIKNVDIPMLDPYREVMTGGSFGGFNFGLQTFEAFIQYQESTDFIKAMDSLRGMKLMLKGDDGKALACNIKNSLQSTMNPDQSLEKEDHESSNKSHFSRQVVLNHGRKQKIYETDEFIDYLLNYYQTPEYARFCFEASYLTSTCQWQRDVYAKGDGFQVNLRKHGCHSTSKSEVESLERKEQDPEQDWPKVYMKAPGSKLEKTEKVNYAKEFTKQSKNHCKDIASETEDHQSPADGESYPVENIHSHGVKDSQHTSSLRSVDVGLPLADFLEEISSDSECFSETRSINEEEEERSVAVYNSSPEKRSLGTDKIITCKQKSRSSQQTLYSEWKHDTEEKCSKQKDRASGKRSKYELRYSWLEDECDAIQVDKNISKTREKMAPKYMLDEGFYHESSSSDELESITRKRRRVTGSMFGQNVNYRPLPMPLMAPKRARAFYLGYFSRKRQNPWKSEYNQDVRRFKRYESSEDYMLDSGNYYVSHDNQEHIEYGSYLGDSYSGSLYFNMF